STMTPHAVPPVTHALALSLQTDRPYVYIAERGRILRLERSSGNLVQQFVAGSDGPPFNDIRALSVDDVLGTAYILNGNALLSVRLPGPPH
ncbi:MAG TPA: hypothetical protein VFI42_08185, partial [Thermomicrobiaceae bacterium]|nr:hypothetical protein [Thermomicrobiaceae bacterium]